VRGDKVQLLRDRLAKIARQDTSVVIAISNAVVRMMKLGCSTRMVEAWLGEAAAEKPTMDLLKPADSPGGFHGFDSKQQAMLALMGVRSKKDWPAAFQSAHERVNTLIGNQEPEAQSSREQQIIVIPGMVVTQAAIGEVKTMRRLRSGKLREIKPVNEDTLEVDEVIEATALDDVPEKKVG
jgi:hypothetical protein